MSNIYCSADLRILRELIEAPCLKVRKLFGGKAIRLAAKLNLLNRRLKVQSDNNYVYVPLLEEPSLHEKAELSKEIEGLEVVRRAFPERERVVKAVDLAAEILPPHLLASFPCSIDFIGHIAIVEIPPELEEYKEVVGEAILKAHKRVRTVLAKAGAVEGTYRLRKFEVIAGSGETETVHREFGCIYHLDPTRVYFSPRLSHEHHRVASQVREGETVIDMFAGVGPFSILTAKSLKSVKVYAIDVNPDAVKYLERNIAANRVEGKVVPILGDARKVVAEKLKGVADRVIMNLPERAFEYVAAACEALKPSGGIIHYYEFAGGDNPIKKVEAKIKKIVEERAGRKVSKVLAGRLVREAAPYTWQVALDLKVE